MSATNPAIEIERLLQYALRKKLLEIYDIIPARNALLELLKIDRPIDNPKIEVQIETPIEVLNNLVEYALENNIIYNDSTLRDAFESKIMGTLMPRQSEVIRKFYNEYNENGAERATDYFYQLSKNSNYIRMDRIMKNYYWKTSTEIGELELNINMSKPNRKINISKSTNQVTQTDYPKCLLCIENVGFPGSNTKPPRHNHRVVPVELEGQMWYMQYSPFMYYDEHCILINGEHVPMEMSDKTINKLVEFVDKFPHYFMGANAELPIVGGTILSHEHFQGGRHVFPIQYAQDEANFTNSFYSNSNLRILNWPMSVIRISCRSREEIVSLASSILQKWKKYFDERNEITAFSYMDKEKIQHNTITPIARKNTNGEYEIDIILRNNRKNDRRPFGIFHTSESLHHIKSENIGLIEAMGLAILPGELYKELGHITEILKGVTNYKNILQAPDRFLQKHAVWIEELIKKYGTNCNEELAVKILQKEIGYKFMNMLSDAGVYKRTEEGKNGFYEFVKHLGFTVK